MVLLVVWLVLDVGAVVVGCRALVKGFPQYVGAIFIMIFSNLALAEFALNFTPQISSPTLSQSVANIGCSDGVSTVGGHNRAGFGCGDGLYFMQEIVDDGVNKYYHVIIGEEGVDSFAQEYYIRTAGCCWFTAKGPANNPMFGEAPLSSSYGDTGKLLSSALFPLAPVTLSGNGAGNPNRLYMKQINQDSDMTLEYTKVYENKKPRITQVVNAGDMLSTFVIDNSNAGYGEQITAEQYVNTVSLYDANGDPLGVGDYDVASQASQQHTTAGQYIYKEGPEVAGSFGMYEYAEGELDPVYINWYAYCNPEENSYRGCVGGPGPGGSGPGGPGADLRAGQEEWWATH